MAELIGRGLRFLDMDEAFRETNLARDGATDSKEALSIVCIGVDLRPRNIQLWIQANLYCSPHL